MSSPIIKEIPFAQWTRQMLFKYFGIRKKYDCPLLKEWIKSDYPLSDFEQQSLRFFGNRAKKAIYDWREADLRDNFLAPVVSLADFHSEKWVFTSFSECPMQVQYKNIVLKGNVEWMAAMGINQPSTPFFFIHEYKPEEPKGNTDGRGQLLAMMLAAKVLNDQPTPRFEPFSWIKVEKNLPVYGSYVTGVNWYFMVLHNNEYCMSEPYNIREEEEFRFFAFSKHREHELLEKSKIGRSKIQRCRKNYFLFTLVNLSTIISLCAFNI